MLGFPLGILSAAGAGGVASDYELISTEILGASAASVTFSTLGDYSSTYKHLQLRIAARSDRTFAADSIRLRFNGDTGSNYARHALFGDGSTVASAASVSDTGIQIGNIFTNTEAANAFGGVVADLLDVYSTTKNKTVKSLAASATIFLRSGVRLNTEAVSTITLTPIVGPNFVAGSRFSLYGVKG